jgi:2-iminobutanoate/2-iminopropanoate deaminase
MSKYILLGFILTIILCANAADSIERLFPNNVPAAIGPYTPVTIAGNMVYISGQIAINPKTGNVESFDIYNQAYQVMENLRYALIGANITFSDIAKTTVLLSDMADFNTFNTIYASYFEKNKYPARACYAVKSLPKDVLL